jgi:hypothetical protein
MQAIREGFGRVWFALHLRKGAQHLISGTI